MHNSYSMPKISVWKRLSWRLLPPTRTMVTSWPLPKGYQDAISIDTEVHLGIRDRLRVLLFGQLTISTVTLTENKPGNIVTETGISTA